MPSAKGSSGGGAAPPPGQVAPAQGGDARSGHIGVRGIGAGRGPAAPMAPFIPEEAQVGVQLTEMNSFFTLLHTWLLPGASPANTGSERLKKWGPGTHHHTYAGGGCTPVTGASGWTTPGARTDATPRHHFSAGSLSAASLATAAATAAASIPAARAISDVAVEACLEAITEETGQQAQQECPSSAGVEAAAPRMNAADQTDEQQPALALAASRGATAAEPAAAAEHDASGSCSSVVAALHDACVPAAHLPAVPCTAPAPKAAQQIQQQAQPQSTDVAADAEAADASSPAGPAAGTAPESLGSAAPADAAALDQQPDAAATERGVEDGACPIIVAAAWHAEAEVVQPGTRSTCKADAAADPCAVDAAGSAQQAPSSDSGAGAQPVMPAAAVDQAVVTEAAAPTELPEGLADSLAAIATTTLAYARNSVSGVMDVAVEAAAGQLAAVTAAPQLTGLPQLPPVAVFRRSSECCVGLTDTGAVPRAQGQFSRGSTPDITPTAGAASAASAAAGLRPHAPQVPQMPQADTPGPSCTSSPASHTSPPVTAAAAAGATSQHAGSTTPTRSATSSRAGAAAPSATAAANTTAAAGAGASALDAGSPTAVDARHSASGMAAATGAASGCASGSGGGGGFPGFAQSSATWDAVAARLGGSGAGMGAVSAGRTHDWLHRPGATAGADAASCDGGDAASVADSTTSIDSGVNPMAAAHAARLAFRSSHTGVRTPTLSPMVSLDGMAVQADVAADAPQQPAASRAAQPGPAQAQPGAVPTATASGQQPSRPPLQHPQLAAVVLRERYASISGGSSSSSSTGGGPHSTPGAGTPGTKAALLAAAEGSAGGSPCSPSLPPPPLCRPNTWSCSGSEGAPLQANLGSGTSAGAGPHAAAGGALSAAQQQAAQHLHARYQQQQQQQQQQIQQQKQSYQRQSMPGSTTQHQYLHERLAAASSAASAASALSEKALQDAAAAATAPAAAGGTSSGPPPTPASPGGAASRLPPAGAVLSGAEPLAALPAAPAFMPSPRCLACGTASMALTQARLQLEALAARHTQLWRQYERLGATASATEARCAALEDTVRRQEAELAALRKAAAAAAAATVALQTQERVLQELRAAASASATAAGSVRSGGTTPRSPHTAGSSPRASGMGNGAVPVLGGTALLSSPSPGGPSPSCAPSPASTRALSQTHKPLQMGSPASALAGMGAWAGGSDAAAAARAAASLRAAGGRSLKQMRYPAAVADSYDDDRGGEPGGGRRGRGSNSGAGIRFHTNPLPLLAASGGLSSARESLQEGGCRQSEEGGLWGLLGKGPSGGVRRGGEAGMGGAILIGGGGVDGQCSDTDSEDASTSDLLLAMGGRPLGAGVAAPAVAASGAGAGGDRAGVALRSSTSTRLMQLAAAAPPVLRSASGGIGRHSRIPVLSMPQLSLPIEAKQHPQPQQQSITTIEPTARDAGCATPTRSLSSASGAVAAKVAALAAAAAAAAPPPGLMSPPGGSSGRAAKPVVLAVSPVVPRAMKFGAGMTSHSNPVAAAAEASRRRAKSGPVPWVNMTSNPLALEEEEEERRAEGH
ncbi:hypothetical protein HXX76_010353 [Chlamydomonas incerta]|uniref:RING-type E3 ubiquitin transferase n=1 Tax=Chlamydomonas incerta TaxID=51695 RepID=A0A835VWA2_CHLIN|nr:hypothetical protein HXX76_010353 [Chlamydomonas incerta]|eukprot:KAG2430255.1 hypothetical protein HXX76_010353 [Chlamydomonas incerta]